MEKIVKQPGKSVKMEEFCQLWQAATSVRELAEMLGIEPAACMSRASNYRKQGMHLKFFPKGRPKLTEADRANRAARVNRSLEQQPRREQHIIDLLREIVGCVVRAEKALGR